MEREELKALLQVEDSSPLLAPMDDVIWLLGQEDLSAATVGVCLLRIEEAAPHFLVMIGRAIAGDVNTPDDWRLFVRGLYILGGARCTKAYRPVLQLLRLPADELEYLLDDVITEDLNRIVSGLFDGDAEALFDLIADGEIDEFVRSSLLNCATFLSWDGRIDADRMKAFLEHFQDAELADRLDYAWVGWAEGIAMLGLHDLQPRVHKAFEDDRFDPMAFDHASFETMLQDALARPRDLARFAEAHAGYIEDAYDALLWTSGPADAAEMWPDESLDPLSYVPEEPHLNPLRHVGRNDPCPCGSGKKAKKCCL